MDAFICSGHYNFQRNVIAIEFYKVVIVNYTLKYRKQAQERIKKGACLYIGYWIVLTHYGYINFTPV